MPCRAPKICEAHRDDEVLLSPSWHAVPHMHLPAPAPCTQALPALCGAAKPIPANRPGGFLGPGSAAGGTGTSPSHCQCVLPGLSKCCSVLL